MTDVGTETETLCWSEAPSTGGGVAGHSSDGICGHCHRPLIWCEPATIKKLWLDSQGDEIVGPGPAARARVLYEHSCGARGAAIYSPCEKYRYLLTRDLSAGGPVLGSIGLNPSTATASQDDPTIRKILGFARRWGYKSLLMGNVFALRSTDPNGLREPEDPIGELNLQYLEQIVRDSNGVLVAWGAVGYKIQPSMTSSVAAAVCAFARTHEKELFCLRETKGGHPHHPLYCSYSVKPKRWQ